MKKHDSLLGIALVLALGFLILTSQGAVAQTIQMRLAHYAEESHPGNKER